MKRIVFKVGSSTITNAILPIVNENDISTIPDQLFGDNDQLFAHVAHYTNADILIILSDIDGYYDDNPKKNPDAKILHEVNEITSAELEQEHSLNNEFASGGITASSSLFANKGVASKPKPRSRFLTLLIIVSLLC